MVAVHTYKVAYSDAVILGGGRIMVTDVFLQLMENCAHTYCDLAVAYRK